jgi:hypothetical protein
MNPLDSLVPPEQLYLAEEEGLQRALLLANYRRLARKEREKAERRRRQQMAQMDQELSSDSETEGLTKDVKNGKMDLTPAGSTPQELVKLDP